MCGFLGAISEKEIDSIKHEESNKRIICRGPDECKKLQGRFKDIFNNDDSFNLDFIFNRLKILDFGQYSSQPMISNEFKSISMFNGEIYNHRELRMQLEMEGVKFKSNHSDSEVVLNGLSKHGIDYVNKFRGQFSIAIYFSSLKKMYLIRDRVGQKPLFYYFKSNNLIFGSNLKSVADLSTKKISNQSLLNYINYGVVPSPETIFKDIYKVKPGEFVEIDFLNENIKTQTYWSLQNYISEEKFDEVKFFELINDAICIREEADVPIANFLSGGIDSTLIIQNMKERGKEINSFSVGFDNKYYDETKWSNQVSKKYSTNHTLKNIKLSNIESYLFEALNSFDEPYSDPSNIPSYVISNAISSKYKVAISGDGGDELSGGYNRTNQILRNKNNNDFIYKILYKIYPPFMGTGNIFKKNFKNTTHSLGSYFSDKKLLSYFGLEDLKTFENRFSYSKNTMYKNLLLTEYNFYLSEMMMLKVDRTSAANSLEVRSPLVDHLLLQYIASTTSSYINTNQPKAILKNQLSKDFNSSFINRPKQGFVFNLEDWVYRNKDVIFSYLNQDLPNLNLNKTKLNSFYLYKSRINALRIWKLFIINVYLDGIN